MSYKYHAFISYSHRDRAWGDWLHKALETYKVPKALVGQPTERGEPVPARVFPVFRDREELPTSTSLRTAIQDALRESRYLIVICSPHSAQSLWVNKEILEYKRLGREDRVLAIIVEGTPNATDHGDPAQECFPPALRFRLGPDGELSTERTEPIAADARPHADGKQNAFLKLLAGVLGVAYDDLKRRDEVYQRQQARRLRIIAGLFALLAIAATCSGLIAWRQQHLAIAERDRAEAAEATAGRHLSHATHLLSEAAQSDRTTAEDRLKAGQHSEALAFLARSLTYEPNTTFAAEKAFSTFGIRPFFLPVAKAEGHSDSIICMEFSPDGSQIVTGAADNMARIWNSTSGRQILALSGHKNWLRSARFNADGTKLVTAADDKSVRVWDTKSGECLLALTKLPAVPLQAILSADGKRLIALLKNQTVSVWAADTGKPLLTLAGKPESVETIVVSPNGAIAATRSDFSGINLWDVQTGELKVKLPAKNSLLGIYSCNADATKIVTVDADTRVGNIWEISSGKLLATLKGHTHFLLSAAFSSDGTRIITVSADRTARIWNAETGKQMAMLIDQPSAITHANFSQNGSMVWTSSSNGTICVWDSATGKRFAVLERKGYLYYSAAIHPNGSIIATASDSSALKLWHVQRATAQEGFHGIEGSISQAWFSPDNSKILAIAKFDKIASLWDIKGGMATTKFLHRKVIQSAAFSHDGTILATSTDDNSLYLWNVADGRRIAALPGCIAPLSKPSFSKDDAWIVSVAEDGGARVWEAKSGRLLALLTVKYDKITSASFTVKNLHVIATSRYGLHRWNLEALLKTTPSAEPIFDESQAVASFGRAGHHGFLLKAIYNQDESKILTLGTDEYAALIGAKTGEMIGRLVGHDKWIQDGIFSPDGNRLVTASGHEPARLWDASTGANVALLGQDEDKYDSAIFSPDGLRVITTSTLSDTPARLWDSRTGRLIATFMNPNLIYPNVDYNSDNGQIIAVGSDGSLHSWSLLPPNSAPPPAWFKKLLHYASQYRINSDGVIEPISFEESLATRKELWELTTHTEGHESAYLRLLRRFLDTKDIPPRS